MSAANYYQPHVYIDGQRLPETAVLGDITALADLAIEWGSNDWFDNIDPAKLSITLLDPFGSMIANAASQAIEVRRDPDDTVVFRGTIEDVQSRYERVTDPKTGLARSLWVHRVQAFDPTHQVMKDRRRGQTYDHRDIDPYRLHWGPCYMSERRHDLNERIPIPIEWQESQLDQYDEATPILIFPVSAYERQQVVSALTVLRNTARISNVMNRPYYFPHEHLIRLIAPRTVAALAPGLTPTPSHIVLRSRHADVQILDGTDFATDSGISISSTAREQITRLELTMRTTRPTSFVVSTPDRYMESVETSQVFDVIADAPAQMTLQSETDHSGGFWYEGPNNGAWAAAGMALLPRYGAAKLDPITYRFEKHAPAPAWALPFLNPSPPMNAARTHPLGYQLINSLTNWIEHASQFAVLGGVLKYSHRRGWEATLHPAANGSGAPTPPPTLGAITISTVIAMASDDSLIADWIHLESALAT